MKYLRVKKSAAAGRCRRIAAVLTAALALGAAGCGDGQPGTEPASGTEQTETGEAYVAQLPTGPEEAEIYVEPIEGLSEDFIKGVDISSIIAEEESGVVYYNEDGEEQDIFQTLADAGVNYIRVRVWNDPYDEDGNGYGGGNNDVEKAAEIGARAAKYGMKLLVDFHYSDFWADPNKQFAPKEWEDMTLEEKETALYEFTKESLQTILDAGADVGMVQIGNEINTGMAGESSWDNVVSLLKEGSQAVREISEESGEDILIAVHFTNIDDKEQIMSYPESLEEAGLDYDVFGVSYYPCWHGTMDNLTEVLQEISTNYGKKVAVLETSYPYTLEEGDGFSNSVSEVDLLDGYTASVQSQATSIRDVMAATAAVGEDALGVFYWEGAWIPVGTSDDYAANEALWEQYGSGWASSYAAVYDPDDAGEYYGGCSWENQALFDFDGYPLASLNVFKYVNYGTICDPAVDYTEDVTVAVNIGDVLEMPETVNVVYNDRSLSGAVAVTWNEEQCSAIDTSVAGEYEVEGTLDGSAGSEETVIACVSVKYINLLENASFEDTDMSMWVVEYEGDENPTDVQQKASDALTGDFSFHFWSESEQSFTIEQTVAGLAAGEYTVNVNLQGGDVGDDAEIYLYAVVGDTVYQSDPVTLDGWVNWKVPEIAGISVADGEDITIGVSVSAAGGGWGTMDDFYLYKQ